jgi:ribosomal protein S18 acetylase RimI-like enzyme
LDPVSDTRAFLATRAPEDLVCDDFTADDVDLWVRTPAERAGFSEMLGLVARGDADYVTVRSPNGVPVTKCGINYVDKPAVGVITQFDTREGLRSLGLGRRLLVEAERRVVARGLHTAELGVELENHRARSLYERLGYTFTVEEPSSWETVDRSGVRSVYRTTIAVLRKTVGT